MRSGRKYIYDGLYDVRQVKVDTGTQGYSVIKFLLVRQVNAENGKLRPNAVPPRHDRILQLVSRHDTAGVWVAFFSRCHRYRCWQGARDGSSDKYEAKAKREREEAAGVAPVPPTAF